MCTSSDSELGVVVFRYVCCIDIHIFCCLRLKPPISEIYQVTGPVERFAGQIASQGYVVGMIDQLFHYQII